MSKLYIFGIGGTGARVIRSLTMLLAAGVDCGADTIVPIIIDRDVANEDLNRTKKLIDNYIDVRQKAEPQEGFFKTDIQLLNGELLLPLQDNTQRFETFIGKSTMSKENKALMEMLFSKDTLNLDMSAGFQGNPNIGSVALNQFNNSNLFSTFANNFNAGDKVFIISSIFGGTGASGFPLLRKTLQTPNVTDAQGNVLPNWGLINNAPIGAISVLPYFNVQAATDGSLVDSDTFIDKTKAALSYYKSEDKKLDTFYYIADQVATVYEHNKGGHKQENDAHFVELASALSIIDFVDSNKAATNINRDDDGNIQNTTYKEFGIKNQDQNAEFNFSSLEDDTKNLIVNPLTRFLLFRNYMEYTFDKQVKYQPYSKKHFRDNFKNNSTIKKLEEIQSDFFKWLEEMEEQERSFTPFRLTSKKATDIVKGKILLNTPKDFRYRNWATVDNQLNRISSKVKSVESEKRFIELFNLATEKLINF